MSGRNNLDELLEVLNKIRKEKYPHIPSEVIKRIVVVQYENQDKRLEARNFTHNIVAEFLNSAANIGES
jgi:hypothetical protein